MLVVIDFSAYGMGLPTVSAALLNDISQIISVFLYYPITRALFTESRKSVKMTENWSDKKNDMAAVPHE